MVSIPPQGWGEPSFGDSSPRWGGTVVPAGGMDMGARGVGGAIQYLVTDHDCAPRPHWGVMPRYNLAQFDPCTCIFCALYLHLLPLYFDCSSLSFVDLLGAMNSLSMLTVAARALRHGKSSHIFCTKVCLALHPASGPSCVRQEERLFATLTPQGHHAAANRWYSAHRCI